MFNSSLNKEAKELDMLIGENIVRLSSLEEMNTDTYKSSILPQLFTFIHTSKNIISQQYLIDCIIKVFPDDYHLCTLKELLEGCMTLEKGVDVKDFISELMERLTAYENIEREGVYEVFEKYVNWVFNKEATKGLLELSIRFIRFSIKLYPDKVDNVLKLTEEVIKRENDEDLLMKLLMIVLKNIPVLKLEYFSVLIGYLSSNIQVKLSVDILQVLISSKQQLNSLEMIDKVLKLIAPLIESENYPHDVKVSLGRLVHFINIESKEQELIAITRFKQELSKGGINIIKATYPSLIWSLYKLSAKDNNLKIFELSFQIAEELTPIIPEHTIKLLLHGALSLNALETIEAESLFMQHIDKALSIYQDKLIDSNVKYKILILVIGTIERVKVLSDKSFDQLTKKVIGSCVRLLRKQDQCKAILMCSHIFVTPTRVIVD